MSYAVQVDRSTELDRLRRTQNRLHGQDQFIDTVLVGYGTIIIEIVRRLTNELMVQTGASAPIKLLVLTDRLLLNEVVRCLVSGQFQMPGVATAGRRIDGRVLVVTRSGDRIRHLHAVLGVGPVVRMSGIQYTGLEVIGGRILGDDNLVDRVTTEPVVAYSGCAIGLAVEGHNILVTDTEGLLDLH